MTRGVRVWKVIIGVAALMLALAAFGTAMGDSHKYSSIGVVDRP